MNYEPSRTCGINYFLTYINSHFIKYPYLRIEGIDKDEKVNRKNI
jgi:hypothetical protein